MTNTQPDKTGSQGWKELAMLVGVLLMVAVGTIATYWIRSRSVEVSAKPGPATAAPAETPTGSDAAGPAPMSPEVIHADVYFDFKSIRLRADAVRILEEKAALMEKASAWTVLAHGYADRQGPPEYNKALARRRAEAVKQLLVELGVPETSVKIVAIGQDGPLCDEARPECQQLNRRVHLEIRKLGRAAVAAPVRPVSAHGAGLQTGADSPDLP